MRLLVVVVLGAWVGRWALLELAGRIANHVPPRPYAPNPHRRPGRMPGPLDRQRE